MSGRTMDYNDEDSIVNGVLDITDQIEEELSKEKIDKKKLCKLRFEQMLRSIYLQNTSPNGLYSKY